MSPLSQSPADRGREAGFTLVELVVVVLVIGVIAAIAVPIYLGAQNTAKNGATKSDLVNAKTAVLVTYSTTKSWTKISTSAADNAATSPVAGAGGFGNSGWASSSAVDDSLTTGGSLSSWCIQEVSAAGTAFYITPADAPTSVKPTAFCS